jgi:hypothetical protein
MKRHEMNGYKTYIKTKHGKDTEPLYTNDNGNGKLYLYDPSSKKQFRAIRKGRPYYTSQNGETKFIYN